MTKAAEALKKVALGVIANSRKGSLSITLDLERIGQSSSVQVKHSIKYNQPTLRGKLVEDNATTTPMHVGRDGTLSINQQSQMDVFMNTSDNVTSINKGTK